MAVCEGRDSSEIQRMDKKTDNVGSIVAAFSDCAYSTNLAVEQVQSDSHTLEFHNVLHIICRVCNKLLTK